MSQAAQGEYHSGLARTIRELQNHVGIENGISARELGERVDAHHSTVRNWIGELRQQGWPIGVKNGYGYFLIQSDGEFQAVMASLESDRESTAETMSALASAHYGQGKRLYYGSGGDHE